MLLRLTGQSNSRITPEDRAVLAAMVNNGPIDHEISANVLREVDVIALDPYSSYGCDKFVLGTCACSFPLSSTVFGCYISLVIMKCNIQLLF